MEGLVNTEEESKGYLELIRPSRIEKMNKLITLSEKALADGDADRVVEIRRMYEYEKICHQLGV